MKRNIAAIAVLMVLSISLYAQEKEIPNTLGAVKAANPGDYIVLPSGKRYVLTKEEIAIARGEFDFRDLSDVKTAVQEDGTVIKIISEGHIVYIYPDGQSSHLLKTSISFTEYMKYVEKNYYIEPLLSGRIIGSTPRRAGKRATLAAEGYPRINQPDCSLPGVSS